MFVRLPSFHSPGVVGNIELVVSGVGDAATTAGTVVIDNMVIVLACVCKGASRSELAAVIKLLSLDIAAVILVNGEDAAEDVVGVVNIVRIDVSLIVVTVVMLISSIEVTDSVTGTATVVEETGVATADKAVSDTSEDIMVSPATVVMIISGVASIEVTLSLTVSSSSSSTLTDSVGSVFRVSTELVNTVIEGIMKLLDPLPVMSKADMLEFCAHTHLQLTTMRDRRQTSRGESNR